MEKKRKLPARGATRSEGSSSKKSRTSTPPEQARAPTPPPKEEPLPTSISAGKPLPTLDHPQQNLSVGQYQSVAESGVMAESLDRSRKKWINEGVFERYWVKPSKKKGVSNEPPNNPPKESMQKIGPCTITIEPHVFDVVMYSVKDTSRAAQPPQPPIYRPIIQYGPQPTPPGHENQSPFLHMQSGQQTEKSQDTHGQMYGPPLTARNGNVPQQLPPHQAHSSHTQHPPTAPAPPPIQQSPAPHPPVVAPPVPPAPTPAPAEAAPATKSSDPVIQMLAERAATDQELKALMRIVADGKATVVELRKFQSHIDELTKLLASRQPPNPPPQPISHPPPPVPQARSGPLQPYETQTPPQNHRPMQPSPIQHGPPNHQLQPQPQALRSKGPLPPTKPDITAVCFEFIGGSGDRFLFPKYSILEIGPGGSVICSFLIVRKGSAADAKAYDKELDYYQPITIRLYAHQSRQLDSLQKVVAPQEEVRKYMDDIMDNMTRAEYVLLAMQLPREDPVQEHEDTPMRNGHPEQNGVLWTTPATNGTPQPHKPVKRPLTEGDQYQNFINTVAQQPV